MIEVATKDVQDIMRATFPEYRRKKVYVRATTSVTFSDLNWSGGTRSEYRGVTVSGQATGSLDKYNQYAPWDARQIEGQTIDLPPGLMIVRSGYFCGKVSMATIYVHPSNMPKLLPVGE